MHVLETLSEDGADVLHGDAVLRKPLTLLLQGRDYVLPRHIQQVYHIVRAQRDVIGVEETLM